MSDPTIDQMKSDAEQAIIADRNRAEHFRRALVDMPDCKLQFKTEAEMKAWQGWVRKYFDPRGVPLEPAKPEAGKGEES